LSKVTIYHNPDCGTSRNVLGLIRNAGIEPTIIEYLNSPPDRQTLISLKTLLLLGCGLLLWVVYGVLHQDIVIMLANAVSLIILAALLYAKMIRS
jgi:uncharacterized protein with PQ loop repeat